MPASGQAGAKRSVGSRLFSLRNTCGVCEKLYQRQLGAGGKAVVGRLIRRGSTVVSRPLSSR